MYVLPVVISKHISPLCRNSHVMYGILNARQFHKSNGFLQMFAGSQRSKELLFLDKPSTFNKPQVRCIHRRDILIQQFFPQYTKDNVPRDYQMVYQSNLGTKQVRMMYILGGVMVIYCGLILYWILKISGSWDYSKRILIPGINIDVPEVTVKFYGLLGMVLLIWFVLSFKFATLPVRRVYECPDQKKFIGIFRRLPWSSERIEFSVEDIAHIPIKPGSILKEGNTIVKGKSCLFYASDFKDGSYFNKFLGYDNSDEEDK